MLFLGFISGKRIRFPREWVKTLNDPSVRPQTEFLCKPIQEVMEQESLMRIHLREASRRRLGNIWEASGGIWRHLEASGGIWKHLGGIWEASRTPGGHAAAGGSR